MAFFPSDVHDRPLAHLHQIFQLGHGRGVDPVFRVAKCDLVIPDGPGHRFTIRHGLAEHRLAVHGQPHQFFRSIRSEISRQRLFADHVLAGPGRLDDEFMMQIGGNANIDGIDILPLQKAPVVIDNLGDAEFLRQCLSAPLRPGRYRQNFDLYAPQGFIIMQMQMGRKLGPDDSNSQWWHEGLLFLT